MDLNEIEQQILNLNGLRKDERKNALNEVAINLYRELKNRGYKVIERDFLKTFFAGSNDTQNNTLNEVIAILKSKNKIVDTEKTKQSIRFLRKDLLTFDNDSYKLLMQKNKYKTYCYKWLFNSSKKIPYKKLIGIFGINNIDTEVLNDCDIVENKSKLVRSNQAVYSNRSLSIAKSNDTYKVKAFLLI